MNPIRSRGEREVEAVVDEKEGTACVASSLEHASETGCFPVGQVFGAELDARDAARKRKLDVAGEVAARMSRVGDQVDGEMLREVIGEAGLYHAVSFPCPVLRDTALKVPCLST
jgi:hypothetical protein